MDPRPTVRSQSRRGCNRCINYSKLINFRAFFRRSSRACIGCQSFSLTFRVVLCILLEAAVTEENVESRLIGDLFRSYEPRARPQFNAVNISLGCWLENILELVNASQVSMHNMLQHLTFIIDLEFLSVCPSVRPLPVLYLINVTLFDAVVEILF